MTPESRARRLAQARRLRFLGLALVGALIMLAVGTALFARQVAASAQLVERQLELNSIGPVLNDTYETLVDMETGQRGYLLTGKERYLGIYHLAGMQLPLQIRQLDDLGHRDAAYSALAQRVHHLADLKAAELDKTVILFGAGDRDKALEIVRTDAGQTYMEELRRLLRDAVGTIRTDRAQLGRQIIVNGSRSEAFAIGAVSALIVTAILAALQIRQLSRSRSHYERDLIRSQEQHRALLEGQREMVSLSDASGTLLYVNPAYAQHFGKTAGELTGANLYDFVEPADREAVKTRIDSVFKGDKGISGENRMLSVDGTPRWVSWSNQLLIGQDGEQRLQSVGRDTTNEKDLSRRLAERERFLRQITDAVPVRIAYIDTECRIQFLNEVTLDRYGLPRDKVIGRRRSELIPNVGDDFVTPYLNAALRGERQKIETPELHGQEVRVIELELIPDVDANGQVQGVYAVGVDITRRKADEQTLRNLAEIFEASPDAIVQTDAAGRITYLNPTARGALGLTPTQELDGLTHMSFHTAETNELFATTVLAQAHEQGSWVGESSMLVRGKTIPMNHLLIAHRGADGQVNRYSAILRDISDQVAQRRELALQTATLGAVIDSVPGMIAVYDAQCRYRLVNRSFETWTGMQRSRCIGHSIEEVFGTDEQARSKPWADLALAGETVSFEKEVPSVRRGRQINISYLPLRLLDGSIDGFIGVGEDVTEQREHERRLVKLSERDPLTGVNNRAGLEAHLERCFKSDLQSDLAIVFVDLDRFKPVNDEFGHAVGDEVLRQFAARLQSAVRPSDVIGRLGGDEFAVVLQGVRDEQAASLVADKIAGVARRPFDVSGRFISIGASFGIAHGADTTGGWQELLHCADQRMYAAKRHSHGEVAPKV